MPVNTAKVLTTKGNKNVAIHFEIGDGNSVLISLSLAQAADLSKGLVAAVKHAHMPPTKPKEPQRTSPPPVKKVKKTVH